MVDTHTDVPENDERKQKLANAHGGKVSISNDSKQGTHVIRFRKPSLFE
jgi:hypothetical protein